MFRPRGLGVTWNRTFPGANKENSWCITWVFRVFKIYFAYVLYIITRYLTILHSLYKMPTMNKLFDQAKSVNKVKTPKSFTEVLLTLFPSIN